MRRLAIPISIAMLALAVLFGAIQIAAGQTPRQEGAAQVVQNEIQGENVRQIEAPVGQEAPLAPDIGFIDLQTGSLLPAGSERGRMPHQLVLPERQRKPELHDLDDGEAQRLRFCSQLPWFLPDEHVCAVQYERGWL